MNKVDRVPIFRRLVFEWVRQTGHREVSRVISEYKKCYKGNKQGADLNGRVE